MRTSVLAKAFTLKNMGKGMVIFNLFGASVFLLLAFLDWSDPQLADYPGSSGGLLIVVGLAMRAIVAIFAQLNFLFILLVCIVYFITRRWSLGWSYLAVPVIWAVAILVVYSQR